MRSVPTLDQFAWLYTRGDESVYMRIEEHGDGFRVIVNGPGWAHASYDFAEPQALEAFTTEYQQQLRSNAFQLQAKAERRSGGERRRGDQPAVDDRRRH